MENKKINILLVLTLLMTFSFMSIFNSKAQAVEVKNLGSHIDYIGRIENTEVEKNYAKGDYLLDTLKIINKQSQTEQIFSLKQIEEIARQDGLEFEGEYSLRGKPKAWPIETIKGIKVYDFLLNYCNLDANSPDGTVVYIKSKDGYSARFTLKELKEKRNSYISSTSEVPHRAGLPAILAYSRNGYPLVGGVGVENPDREMSITDGYIKDTEGFYHDRLGKDVYYGNNNGPLRFILGQSEVGDFNAQSTGKYLSEIIIGDRSVNPKYNQHNRAPYDSVLSHSFKVNIFENGNKTTKQITLEELESKAKAINTSGNYYNSLDYYEGVNISWVLTELLNIEVNSKGYMDILDSNSNKINDGNIDLDYFRGTDIKKYVGNMVDYMGSKEHDDYVKAMRNYTTTSNAIEKTGVTPIIAYSKNGVPLMGNVQTNNEGPLVMALSDNYKYDVNSFKATNFNSINIYLGSDTDLDINEKDYIEWKNTHTTNIDLNKEWKINFSKEVDEKTLNENILIIEKNTKSKVQTIARFTEENKKQVIIEHSDQFKANTEYILYIKKGVSNNVDGKSLESGIKMEFKTKN